VIFFDLNDGVAEVSIPLGRDLASLGKWFMTFPKRLSFQTL